MRIGKVPENVLRRSVLRQIRARRKEIVSGAGVGKDCAILSLGPGERLLTCVQEAVVRLGGTGNGTSGVVLPEGTECGAPGDMEALMTLAQLIQKCANNLAAGGGRPVAVEIALILPESVEEADIRSGMRDAEEKCLELSVEIAGGQTRISRAVSAPVAVVSGWGRAPEDCAGREARPGQDVVLSKWIGLQGTAQIAARNREKLLARYPARLVETAAGFDRFLSVIPEAAAAVKSGVCAMHDASEGGILGALWELAEGAGVGLTINMRKLPLRQETVEVCECCDANPYELLSGGCLIMTAQDGPGLVAALEKERIPAVIVGKVTDSNDRILVNGEEVRYMDRPAQDAVYGTMPERRAQDVDWE